MLKETEAFTYYVSTFPAWDDVVWYMFKCESYNYFCKDEEICLTSSKNRLRSCCCQPEQCNSFRFDERMRKLPGISVLINRVAAFIVERHCDNPPSHFPNRLWVPLIVLSSHFQSLFVLNKKCLWMESGLSVIRSNRLSSKCHRWGKFTRRLHHSSYVLIIFANKNHEVLTEATAVKIKDIIPGISGRYNLVQAWIINISEIFNGAYPSVEVFYCLFQHSPPIIPGNELGYFSMLFCYVLDSDWLLISARALHVNI